MNAQTTNFIIYIIFLTENLVFQKFDKLLKTSKILTFYIFKEYRQHSVCSTLEIFTEILKKNYFRMQVKGNIYLF